MFLCTTAIVNWQKDAWSFCWDALSGSERDSSEFRKRLYPELYPAKDYTDE